VAAPAMDSSTTKPTFLGSSSLYLSTKQDIVSVLIKEPRAYIIPGCNVTLFVAP